MQNRSHISTMALAAVSALPAAHAASAQEAKPSSVPSAQASIDDIIVTARRRAERVQDVPIAITALAPETLQARSIATNEDLARAAPALTTISASGGGRALVTYTIRGQGASQQQDAAPGVIAYLADVPLPSTIATPYYDIAGIDVLEGPQGTLFGRNTTGGAILIRPQAPTAKIGGYMRLRIGNFDTREIEGALNLPIDGDRIMLRVAGNARKQRGYVENLTNGRYHNDVKGQFFRATLALAPSDSLKTSFIVDYSNLDQNGAGLILKGVDPNGVAATFFPAYLDYFAEQQQLGTRKARYDAPMQERLRSVTYINTTTLDFDGGFLGDVTLKNIASYSSFKSSLGRDFDFSPLPIVNVPSALSRHFGVLTEEFQIQGRTHHLDYVVGAFYLDLDPLTRHRVSLNQILFGGPPIVERSWFNDRSKAVFGQATYRFGGSLEGLSFTAGLRHTWDSHGEHVERYAGAPQQCVTPSDDGTGCGFFRSAHFEATTYSLGVDYKLNTKVLLYAVTRKGYKAGSINNVLSPTDPLFFVKPEKVNDVEGGIKADWSLAGMPVRTNAALFYSRYNDIQRGTLAVINGQLTAVQSNVAKAEIYGGELSLLLRPAPLLTLTANYSLNKAKFLEFGDAVAAIQSGGQLASIPEHKISLNAEIVVPLSGHDKELSINTSYFHQSKSYFCDNIGVEPFCDVPAFDLVNGRAELRNILGKGSTIGAFVNNLFDKQYILGGSAIYNDLGLSAVRYSEPRTFGIDARFSF